MSALEEREVEALLSLYSTRPHSPDIEDLMFDLERGMRHLDDRQQRLVWLHGVEGRPYREVANRVGCSHTLARRHYRRAVCQLIKFLRP